MHFRGEGLTEYRAFGPLLCHVRTLLFLFPELHLIRDFGLVRTLALVVIWPDHRHAFFPLFIRDVEQPHIARLRHHFLDDAQMLAQLLEVHAWARIDGKLNHQKSVVKEVVAEARGHLPLLVGHHRQIKHGHEPAHTEWRIVHSCVRSSGCQSAHYLVRADSHRLLQLRH
jgi:hypothetical protein